MSSASMTGAGHIGSVAAPPPPVEGVKSLRSVAAPPPRRTGWSAQALTDVGRMEAGSCSRRAVVHQSWATHPPSPATMSELAVDRSRLHTATSRPPIRTRAGSASRWSLTRRQHRDDALRAAVRIQFPQPVVGSAGSWNELNELVAVATDRVRRGPACSAVGGS